MRRNSSTEMDIFFLRMVNLAKIWSDLKEKNTVVGKFLFHSIQQKISSWNQ